MLNVEFYDEISQWLRGTSLKDFRISNVRVNGTSLRHKVH